MLLSQYISLTSSYFAAAIQGKAPRIYLTDKTTPILNEDLPDIVCSSVGKQSCAYVVSGVDWTWGLEYTVREQIASEFISTGGLFEI